MNKPSIIIFLACCLLINGSCKEDKEEQKLGNDYSGSLKLEYSRNWLGFNAIVEMEVEVTRDGDFIFSQPDQASYSGEGENWDGGDGIKMNETGTVTVAYPDGKVSQTGGEDFIEITTETVVSGTLKVWGWDDELGWMLALETPFEPADPVSYPMRFSLSDATLTGDVIGATIQDPFGLISYKWTLFLTPVK
jgi:hypothetical protein